VARSIKAQMERYGTWFGNFERPGQDEEMAKRWQDVIDLADSLIEDFLDDGN